MNKTRSIIEEAPKCVQQHRRRMEDGRSCLLNSDIAKTFETLRATMLVADLSEDGVALLLLLVESESEHRQKYIIFTQLCVLHFACPLFHILLLYLRM